MATKPKAAAKAAVSAVAAKSKAKPTGLQLSAAQWQAYSKAFNSTAKAARNKVIFQAAVQRLMKYRLNAANTSIQKANAARTKAQTAAIASYAARRSLAQSRIGHQNAALQARIGQAVYRHIQVSGRLQYAQAGEKAYAHSAVMRTLDTAQATSHEAKVFKAISKTAYKASKSTKKTTKISAVSAANAKAISAAANTAGLKAAKAAKGRTAPAPWLDSEGSINCVVIAVANHLLNTKGIKADPEQIAELCSYLKPEPTIEDVLWQVYLGSWPRNSHVRLQRYKQVDYAVMHENVIIGFESENGPHAALAISEDEVISWGTLMKREAPVEETWELAWQLDSNGVMF